jgi:hypothetical protein
VTDLDASTALLKQAYAAFNARDLERALSTMRPDVEWPNGMEGGTVHGHEGVRQYWTRQWGMINPHVDPVSFGLDGSGHVVVGVHQVVRELWQIATGPHGAACLSNERWSHSAHDHSRVIPDVAATCLLTCLFCPVKLNVSTHPQL